MTATKEKPGVAYDEFTLPGNPEKNIAPLHVRQIVGPPGVKPAPLETRPEIEEYLRASNWTKEADGSWLDPASKVPPGKLEFYLPNLSEDKNGTPMPPTLVTQYVGPPAPFCYGPDHAVQLQRERDLANKNKSAAKAPPYVGLLIVDPLLKAGWRFLGNDLWLDPRGGVAPARATSDVELPSSEADSYGRHGKQIVSQPVGPTLQWRYRTIEALKIQAERTAR